MSKFEPLALRAGELVEVRTEQEILATLDERGTLDGLPFMPEMLAFCGQRVRVEKRADKACDTINYSGNRRMYDAVLLEGGRCSGAAHGGCQARCLLFWKEAWLRRAEPTPTGVSHERLESHRDAGVLSARACDRKRLVEATRAAAPNGDEGPRYRCQATDLLLATAPMAWWDLRQYARDVRSGNVRFRDVVGAALFRVFVLTLRLRGYRLQVWTYNKLQSWRGGRPFPFPLDGTLDRTPRATLGLKPGELVRVKSKEDILKTLNKRNRNHGLSFDREMVRYCGNVYRVLSRVEQIIEEPTGRMIKMSNDCIILEGVTCQAELSDKRLFCPRSLYPFWREIWLERVPAAEAPVSPCITAGTASACGVRR
jgi:hypothetical protein